MAAASQYATMVISNGASSINVDVYCSDVVNANTNMDSGGGTGGTGSLTYFKTPITGRIVDFSIATGMTDTTAAKVTINGSATKSTIRWANHLNTLNSRPLLNIPVNAGEDIGLIQLA